MLKIASLLTTTVLLAGCYEETVVEERRSYRPRHHVSHVSDRPYDDGYYRDTPRRQYRDGYYDDDRPTVYRVDDERYVERPVRRRVTVGF